MCLVNVKKKTRRIFNENYRAELLLYIPRDREKYFVNIICSVIHQKFFCHVTMTLWLGAQNDLSTIR